MNKHAWDAFKNALKHETANGSTLQLTRTLPTEVSSVHTRGACILPPHNQTRNQNPPSSFLSAVISSGYKSASACKTRCILNSYTLYKDFILNCTIIFACCVSADTVASAL